MSIVRRQAGFSLIEVLVSTLVLTVGVLGVAAMQMVSFQTNQSAYARSQAVYIAQDILDRMRANPQGYNSSAVYNSVDSNNTSSVPANPNCVTGAGGCTPTQMAQQDVREWAEHFYNVRNIAGYRPTLPNGRGVLARVGTTNNFTVTVSWNDRDFDTAGNLTRDIVTRQVSIQATMN